ncbi:MarR family transcriptional regulator [Vibrio sp. FNV 38]|nr:MarR family transcriptional regulator [Vibrio sp. FNV 38]
MSEEKNASQNSSLESVFGLVHAIKREMHGQIEQLGLPITPMHVRVMKIISKMDQCTANDISRFLSRDKAQVTRLLKSLIDEGLLDKAPNPEDKRSQFLIVTELGKGMVDKVATVEKAMLTKMSQNITQEELKQFEIVTNQMKRNLMG